MSDAANFELRPFIYLFFLLKESSCTVHLFFFSFQRRKKKKKDKVQLQRTGHYRYGVDDAATPICATTTRPFSPIVLPTAQ